jgi:choline dehydrogenase-like flavoprotein
MIKTIAQAADCEYDVCIIGSGPAGMTVCAELATSGLRVVVVESGGEGKSVFTDTLRHIECSGIGIRENSRERIVGGASETWGGMSAPLDAIDFEKRPYAKEHEGWPLTQAEITPYLQKAGERYRFAMPADFKPENFLSDEKKEDTPWSELEPKTFLAVRPAFQFGKELRYLFARGTVDLITDATVTELVLDSSNTKKVSGAVCRGAKGELVKIRAKEFVLATGAIENTRILLNSKRASPQGIGNEFDQVGRYFMNHPKGYLGAITLKKRFPHGREYFWKKKGEYSGYIGLRLREDIQRSKKVLNSYVRLEEGFPWTNRQEMRVVNAFISHAKKCVVAIVRSRVGVAAEMKELWNSLPYVIVSLPGYVGLLVLRLSRIGKPYPTHLLPRYFLEMEPRSTNRITLSKTTDAFGVPIPHVRHELSELDKASFTALEATLARECEALGIGTLHPTGKVPSEDASHHLGSTRMGTDPKTSVVNTDLRVHSTENVYVAGGSVFPTSGCANSTFMMVALSIRLAEHLREKVFHISETLPTQSRTAAPVLIIGAGRRVRSDIVPVLESLSGQFSIQHIYARSPRAIFGKERVYQVDHFSAFNAGDIAKTKLIYLSIPSVEVQATINALLTHDCSHIDLVLPTPVSPDLSIKTGTFRRVVVEEDSGFLPWLPAFARACASEAGKLKQIVLDRSAYKYHAAALIKTLCRIGGPASLRRVFSFSRGLHFRSGEITATLVEPRDYSAGRMELVCEHATVADKDIQCLTNEQGICTGFRIGTEIEHMTSEESELFGAIKTGDTVITRMHDCKRVGLRRLLHALEDGHCNPWSLEEGKSDAMLASSRKG